MQSTGFAARRKVRAAGPRPAVCLVNLSRFALVVDPFRKDDPDEQTPPCPLCQSAATLWFIDRRTTKPQLVCLDCAPAGR